MDKTIGLPIGISRVENAEKPILHPRGSAKLGVS